MSLLPPLLPKLNGGRPAAGSVGQAAATIRLGARVVAITGADLLIETGHGRALLQGAPALRPGAALLLEVQHPEPALARTGRVVAVGQQRLEPPLPVRLHPVSPSPTAATMRSAAALEVSLRTLGPDGRPTTPAFPARLAVPEPAPALPGSSAMVVSPSGGAARGSALPGASSPADTVLPTNAAVAPTAGRPAAARGLTGPSTASAVTRAPPAPTPLALAQQPGVPAGPGHLIEVVVLPRDALGRILLRAPAFTFQVDTPVDLPVGARLQLSLPGPPRSSAAPLQAGPLEAVRTLAASLAHTPDRRSR